MCAALAAQEPWWTPGDGHGYHAVTFGPNPRAFGHVGGGGSVGMADADRGIGFGFTMNNMQPGMVSAGSTPAVLIDTFYDILDGA
jgi:CubicO group peptidase (beta-lactamase class C family)